jgi:hypothetical protein
VARAVAENAALAANELRAAVARGLGDAAGRRALALSRATTISGCTFLARTARCCGAGAGAARRARRCRGRGSGARRARRAPARPAGGPRRRGPGSARRGRRHHRGRGAPASSRPDRSVAVWAMCRRRRTRCLVSRAGRALWPPATAPSSRGRRSRRGGPRGRGGRRFSRVLSRAGQRAARRGGPMRGACPPGPGPDPRNAPRKWAIAARRVGGRGHVPGTCACTDTPVPSGGARGAREPRRGANGA